MDALRGQGSTGHLSVVPLIFSNTLSGPVVWPFICLTSSLIRAALYVCVYPRAAALSISIWYTERDREGTAVSSIDALLIWPRGFAINLALARYRACSGPGTAIIPLLYNETLSAWSRFSRRTLIKDGLGAYLALSVWGAGGGFEKLFTLDEGKPFKLRTFTVDLLIGLVIDCILLLFQENLVDEIEKPLMRIS